jgi:MFS family permease
MAALFELGALHFIFFWYGDILMTYALLGCLLFTMHGLSPKSLVITGIALIALTLFVVFNPDRPSKDLVAEPFSGKAFLSTFWVNPIAHPDFFWGFTGRLLLYTGFFAVTGYQLFILQDYIGLGNEGALAMVPILGITTLLGIVVSTVICGPLSDRLERRKVFIFVASILLAGALLIPIVLPTATGMIIFAAVSGLGFGCFQSVDTALISEVLPSEADFAKDLGVVNIAATLPQTIAPAVAGVIVVSFGGYLALFPIGIVLVVLGAFAVLPIKSVR